MPRLTAQHVRIPMRYAFGHARASRQIADVVIVRLELEDGTVGFGECVPRDYVTGETIETVLERLTGLELDAWLPPVGCDFARAAKALWELDLAAGLSRGRLSNAAACALEGAMLDAFARREGRNVLDVLDVIAELQPLRSPTPKTHVARTLTLGDDLEASLQRAGDLVRPLAVKLKVGFGEAADLSRLVRVRAALGPVDLRLDANGVWTKDEALRQLGAFLAHHPTCIEEPLPQRAFEDCAWLKRQLGLEVMLDESLCTLDDARAAHQASAAGLFNLRLSKCGGLLNTLRIARFAQAHGLGYQLGSMVGETGILGCTARAFAARVVQVRYLEAAVPRQLLEADVTDAALDEAPGTRLAPVPRGPGFGANVDPAALARFTVSTRVVA